MRDFHRAGRSTVHADRGICATSHPLAAMAAIDILKKGGNAVDAAIAGAVLLGICEPQMTGIGGDCFALISNPGDGQVHALNGSGRAPAGLDAEQLRAAGHSKIPTEGALPVTVPGAIAGFETLSARFGRLGLAASLAPAIDYAETGVPVAPRVAFDWMEDAPRLIGDARKHYLKNGAPLAVGDLFRAPGQAEVLRAIAEHGAQAFYTGEIAADMVGALRANGGSHTEEDFAACQADWTIPFQGHYRGLDVVEHPPNGQGTIALLMLQMLAEQDLSGLDPFGAERVHLEAQIARLAYDARDRLLADPDYMADTSRLHDPAFARELLNQLDRQSAPAGIQSPREAVHQDTILITVVDQDRMAVSLIYSIFNGFGSGLASPRYGILLQNRGAGFSLEPGHPNEAGPGKRPMHTIIPGMAKRDGKVIMPFGVMGGQFQPTGHCRLISNMVDFGMDPQEAIDAPRAFAIDGELRLERGYDASVRTELERLGHRITIPAAGLGGAQAIVIDPDTGRLTGASDPRKDGIALGY
ncbi:gamma-glutamyltransferase family protein [Aliiruegeria lutimaris]|uniref:Gamma-glutamyltransferase 2. Threonine peptidase. MEROPS family T03 n=1 Tax=Aliiruegeria lutimaris TaxID=571298 RepID=A0A1G8MC71_9RHOB|nr:gamma-glutamyltransferase family protein [Aliiruegeria lutimaris]SDI65539.1 gamma-glutamyltransferase 2. Threonine peptidase. MEROPS family T03 [Aliiruegeria lutimaris]